MGFTNKVYRQQIENHFVEIQEILRNPTTQALENFILFTSIESYSLWNRSVGGTLNTQIPPIEVIQRRFLKLIFSKNSIFFLYIPKLKSWT